MIKNTPEVKTAVLFGVNKMPTLKGSTTHRHRMMATRAVNQQVELMKNSLGITAVITKKLSGSKRKFGGLASLMMLVIAYHRARVTTHMSDTAIPRKTILMLSVTVEVINKNYNY